MASKKAIEKWRLKNELINYKNSLSDKNCNKHIPPSHLMYGRNINRWNLVDGNDDNIMLDKTLIKTRTKQVPAIDFMKNIFY